MAKVSKKVNTKTKQKDKKQQAVKPKITKAQLTKKPQLKDKKAGRPKVNNAKIKKTSRSIVNNEPMVSDEQIAVIVHDFSHLISLAIQALQLYVTKHQNTHNDNINIASDDNVVPSDQSDSTTDKEIEEQ